MKVDTDSVRELLTTIPNTVLVEMEHHGDDAMCCGCRAAELRPEIGNTVTERRIQEAVATGAETMIDVCHNCHWLFSNYQKETGRKEVKLVNYSTYIAKALGISREDSMTEGDQQNN